MRPQGSPAKLERRRLRAIELLKQGLEVHQVASQLGVERRSVRRWKQAHRRQGKKGVLARIATGRPAKLTPAQRRSLVRMILKGPQAFGFRNALWACPRDCPTDPKILSCLLSPQPRGPSTACLRTDPQRPQTAAKERDAQGIGHWLHWVRLKKLARKKARLICLDETGFLMVPLIRRTWALRGFTPTLHIRSRSHEKVSGIGALVVSSTSVYQHLFSALSKREHPRVTDLKLSKKPASAT